MGGGLKEGGGNLNFFEQESGGVGNKEREEGEDLEVAGGLEELEEMKTEE